MSDDYYLCPPPPARDYRYTCRLCLRGGWEGTEDEAAEALCPDCAGMGRRLRERIERIMLDQDCTFDAAYTAATGRRE